MQNLPIQLSLPNIFSNINKSFVSNKSNLLSLIEEHINFDSFIPLSFRYAFYSHMGRDHIYHFDSFIRALVFQKILAIDVVKLTKRKLVILSMTLLVLNPL